MVLYISYPTPLDGTNDVPFVLSTPAVSITIIPRDSAVTVSVKPNDRSDFVPLSSGRTLNLEPVQAGRVIDPCRITLRGGSATTADVLVGYP